MSSGLVFSYLGHDGQSDETTNTYYHWVDVHKRNPI